MVFYLPKNERQHGGLGKKVGTGGASAPKSGGHHKSQDKTKRGREDIETNGKKVGLTPTTFHIIKVAREQNGKGIKIYVERKEKRAKESITKKIVLKPKAVGTSEQKFWVCS